MSNVKLRSSYFKLLTLIFYLGAASQTETESVAPAGRTADVPPAYSADASAVVPTVSAYQYSLKYKKGQDKKNKAKLYHNKL